MPRRAKAQLGTSALVRTSAYVVNEPIRVFVAQLGKVCRNEGMRTSGGHDHLKGQGKAAEPGRVPP